MEVFETEREEISASEVPADIFAEIEEFEKDNKFIEKIGSGTYCKIVLDSDVHARQAALFIQNAVRFDSDIYLIANNEMVDGKSILAIMNLKLRKGTKIFIRAVGDDEIKAVQTLRDVVYEKF